MNRKRRRRASRPQAVYHRVLPEPDITAQAIGDREVELSVGGKHRGIGAAGGREFFDRHELSVFPLIDTRCQIGLRCSGRSMNEIDFDQIQSLRRLGHGKLAGAGTAQRLMRYETTVAPTIEKRFAGQTGKGEPSVAIRAKKLVCTPALRCEFLERRERPAVPNHQTGRTGMVRVSEEMLPVDVEINPFITPPSRQGLKGDEFISVPFEYARVPRVPCCRAVDGHPLSKREKAAITDGEIMPLLCRKGWKCLERLPP